MTDDLDAALLRDAQPDIAALAHLPKAYAATVPPWAGQVTTLPGPMTITRASALCDGMHVALAAYGPTAVRGTEAFAYLWRRFGPPWWGCDPHKDLVGYWLRTPDPEVILTLHLSASTLPYAVGYLVTKPLRAAWYANEHKWNAQFETWWMTSKLTEGERAALRMVAADQDVATPPLVYDIQRRLWYACIDEACRKEAEAVLGLYPQRPGRHPGVQAALHAALVECLRPVFIRDVAINILGPVPDEQLDEREEAEPSIYAGYGVPQDAQRKEN
jgi:hypothetical protein